MESMLHNLGGWLLDQSLQLVPVFAAAWLACFLLRRASAHWRYLLWLVVLAKCVMPGFFWVSDSVLPGPVGAIIAKPEALFTARPAQALSDSNGALSEDPALDTVVPVQDHSIFGTASLSPLTLLAGIWLAGIVVYAGLLVRHAIRFHIWLLKARTALPPADCTRARELARRLGLSRLPQIWVVPGIAQPFVWGLWRGGIYLPQSDESRSAAVEDGVLAHELAHVARGDVIVNALRLVVHVLFFFHPLAWLASRRLQLEQEKCCDELSIAALAARPADYAEAVLRAVSWTERTPAAQVSIAGTAGQLEERIRSMLHPGKKFRRRPTFSAVVVSVIFAAVSLSVAFADDVQTKVREAVQILSTSAETQTDRVLSALDLIRACPQTEALPALAKYLDDSMPARRRAAIYALQMTPWDEPKPAFEPLRKLLKHEEEMTRGMAAMALASLGDADSLDTLVKIMQQDPSAFVQRCAAFALGELGLQKAKPELEKAAKSNDGMVAANARNALERLAFLESNAKLEGPAAKARQGVWLISGSTIYQEARLRRADDLIRQCPEEQRNELLERWSKSDSMAIRNSVQLAQQRLEEK